MSKVRTLDSSESESQRAQREVLFSDHSPGTLQLEIDGPDVHPHTVDTVSLLEMASAFLSIVTAEAAQKGTELRFHGISITDKCIRLEALASDRGAALAAAVQTRQVLRGDAVAARGTGQYIQRYYRAARVFDKPGHRLVAMSADWALPLEFVPAKREAPMDSLVTLRAKIMRSGGTEPAVKFSSLLESDEFTLDVTADQARELGNQLYRELELEAHVRRGPDGNITGGRVLSYQMIDADCEDPWAAWQQWYADVNRE